MYYSACYYVFLFEKSIAIPTLVSITENNPGISGFRASENYGKYSPGEHLLLGRGFKGPFQEIADEIGVQKQVSDKQRI